MNKQLPVRMMDVTAIPIAVRLRRLLQVDSHIARNAVGQVQAVRSGQLLVHYSFRMGLLLYSLFRLLLLEEVTDKRSSDRKEQSVWQQVHVVTGVGLRKALCHVTPHRHCQTCR